MRRLAVSSIVVLVALLAFPHSAHAVGELTPGGCIDDNDSGADVCAQAVNGLDSVASVAVSPDGKSVYAVSVEDHALVRFNRSATGALTPGGCIDDNDTGPDVCARSVNGLAGANAVTVSPDGRSVYVAAFGDNAIVRFNRDATGALTPAGCVDDNDSSDDVCALSVNGLEGANDVVVSPDGNSVYVPTNNDNTIVRFNRSSTGALTSGGCIDDNDDGPDVCAQSVNGLEGAVSIAISPDGKSVYAAALSFLIFSDGDNAVTRFNRSSTGALTPAGCVDDVDAGPDVCAQTAPALTGVGDLAVSSDGKSLYAVAGEDRAVTLFDRTTAGAITPVGCIQDENGPLPDCAQTSAALSFAAGIDVSPDDKSVYVTAGSFFIASGDSAVTRFDRSMSGALTPAGCVQDNDTDPVPCAQAVNGLEDAGDVTVSPDGSVYVTAFEDDAVVRFNRAT